jgi:hypothetical protein
MFNLAFTEKLPERAARIRKIANVLYECPLCKFLFGRSVKSRETAVKNQLVMSSPNEYHIHLKQLSKGGFGDPDRVLI